MKTKTFCIGDLKLIKKSDYQKTFYIYKKKIDDDTIDCYGTIECDSNFVITCIDEYDDGIVADIDTDELNTWKKVCEYLENNYDGDIVEITTC
jgi:hypothetical protein